MTKKDIVNITKIHRSDVNKAFVKASQTMPSIRLKTTKCRKKGSRGQADFTLEEILYATSFLRGGKGLNELEEKMVRETFVAPLGDVKFLNPWAGYIDGTQDFVENAGKERKCCARCEYCTTKKKGAKYKPYCNLFNYHVAWRGKDPYKTFCSCFSRSKSTLLFRRNGKPVIKGEQPRKLTFAGFDLDIQ